MLECSLTATKTMRGGEATNFSLSLANGVGSGRTKKEAEQAAAGNALGQLK